MYSFTFADREFLALPERALFWPERRALLVADLHLEKASWFAARGQMLPPFDSAATLTKLLALAIRTDAQEIWALGDSFHDDAGPGRLDDEALALVEQIARGRRIIWIAGNHDSDGHLPGERCDEAEFGDLVLRHEALPDERRYEISGHFHPKLRVQGAARSVSRPCFALGDSRLILPAFGALTGGLDIASPVIVGLLGPDPCGLIATAGGLHRYPVAPPLSRGRATRRKPLHTVSVTF